MAAAALAAVALMAAPAHADAPAPGSVPPDQDPFYAAPANIGTYAPGQIVATRPVTPAVGYLAWQVKAWQISYRTSDSHGAPELAVTSLLVPTGAWTGQGARPVVSLQAAEDSTGTQCSPSYDLDSNSSFSSTNAVQAEQMLVMGWAVAEPDFEGPKSVFMGGLQAGHAVLDGIRAVRNFGQAGIGTGNRWGLYGYSGGAEATGWAAQLQPSYAPEIKLAGAAMGGTPADPAAVARSLDGGPSAGFEAAAAASLEAEYPEAGISGLLNAQGVTALRESRGQCIGTLLAKFKGMKLADYSTVPDPLAVPSVAKVLKENTLGATPPATPIYDYHSNADEIVPVGQDDTLVHDWCAAGATVQKTRDPFGQHTQQAVFRALSVNMFLNDRFTGKPGQNDCA
ncbi:lipase family protein [Actinomadura rupiterrae]|uniref:lipase family protein n=1 Tax=Actinomadura rupiterrae TaxID=559627 RepID=UPI0020A2995A|nr:lipase family protein [Actinomadura rupiterrae]MCP2341392.1 hypothetical protein [Actinomadura rupiterrae]